MHSYAIAWTPDHWAAAGSVAQAVATVFTLAVAVFAARYAARQVKEARAQVDEARKTREAQAEHVQHANEEQARREQRLREEQARPFVVVDFEPSPVWGNLINLVFENVGKTLARNIRFTFTPALETTLDKEDDHFRETTLLQQGIPAMPPGRRVVALFDVAHDRLAANLPMTYNVRVDLQDSQGRPQEALEYVLDLSFHYGIRRVESKTVHDLAKVLEKIERNTSRWTQHMNGLRVWVRDEEAYLSRRRAEYEERRAQAVAADDSSGSSNDPDQSTRAD